MNFGMGAMKRMRKIIATLSILDKYMIYAQITGGRCEAVGGLEDKETI